MTVYFYEEIKDKIYFTLYLSRGYLSDVMDDVHSAIMSMKTKEGVPLNVDYEIVSLNFNCGLPQNDYGQTVEVVLRKCHIKSGHDGKSIVFAA